MADGWSPVNYRAWSATCDTLHAHTQVLGKLAVKLAPPEPQLQHAALRLSARGWETPPLPTPDGSGAIVVTLDLHAHEAVVEHSGGHETRIALTRIEAAVRAREASEREARSSEDRMRQFVADAGHELRTPLSVVRTELELALRHAGTIDELRDAVRRSSEEVDRLAQLAEDLLLIARSDRGPLPLRIETVEEIMADPDLATVEKYIEERIVYREDNQTIHLLFDYGYEIDLDLIQTPEHLLRWTHQLLDKAWMDNQKIRVFIEADHDG